MSLSESSFILKNDGTLWGCGLNDYGQLGLGDTTNRVILTKITNNANDIKSVYCGFRQTFILKNDGTLFGCGWNVYGQLGLGDTTSRTTLTQITNNVKSAYCGYAHTIILKNDGTLWGCGFNYYGQLGLGDTNDRTTFTQITSNIDNIKSFYCGNHYTLILKNDSTLWGCGCNEEGRLGLGEIENTTIFTKIIDDVKSVYCGGPHTFILKNDGTLWGTGRNDYGQLGLGDTTNRNAFTKVTINGNDVKSVYCGCFYTSVFKNNGTLWGCGKNDYGQLGLGDTTDRTIFTIIGINTNNIKLVCRGYNYMLILKNDGTLWGTGYNSDGELGLEDTINRTTFTQITTNANDIKCFVNEDLGITNTIKIYDLKIGYTETLDTNNFRNIPVDKVEKLKVLCTTPDNTYLNCLISFDKKQTWKAFYGTTWATVSDITPENIILNGMQLKTLDKLDKNKLIAGGFTGDLDFKIAIKTNNDKVTSSITKIYIEYK